MNTGSQSEEGHVINMLNRGNRRNHAYFGMFLVSLFLSLVALYYFTEAISAFVAEVILGG